MQEYTTRQRTLLLDFFNAHSDEQLSVSQIMEGLEEYDISRSAVYRNLQRLEKEGKIRRLIKSGQRMSYYQYFATIRCSGKLHFSCIKCGRTEHVAESTARSIARQLSLCDSCYLDTDKTVLYGVCRRCGIFRKRLRARGHR